MGDQHVANIVGIRQQESRFAEAKADDIAVLASALHEKPQRIAPILRQMAE